MAGLLQGKVAVITGAGKGIGKAIAEAYAGEGATVVVSDIDEGLAKETASRIPGAPAIIASGGGAIVNICSITAQAGTPLIGHYSAAKAGVMSLTQTAAVELRAQGVRVNAVLPGFVETEMVTSVKADFERMLGFP